MKHIYRITLLQQALLLRQLITTHSILISVYIYYWGVTIPTVLFLILFSVIFITDIVPTLFIHFQYLYENWGAVFCIDTENQTVSYKSSLLNIEKKINEIVLIQRFSSYGSDSGWYSFGQYRYYRIIFNDGSKFNITCLMMNKMENEFKTLIKIEPEKEVIWLGLICKKLEE